MNLRMPWKQLFQLKRKKNSNTYLIYLVVRTVYVIVKKSTKQYAEGSTKKACYPKDNRLIYLGSGG